MLMDIPKDVELIINELEAAGYEAYAVGGCVRDSILHRVPGDWDITTSAKPEQVKSVFNRTIDTGIEHGTVTVMIGKTGYEVTTYRIDGEYEDSRHPKAVVFTASLREDLRRRDFTINAMAYNPKTGIVDLFDGQGDIERGVIRCVGCAGDRFDEDALRMMRAVRFSAQLGFEIDDDTAKAIRERAEHLNRISAERIQTELVKLLTSAHPEYIHKAYILGITKVVMPEYDDIVGLEQRTPNHIYTVDEHTLIALKSIEPDPVLRLTMLMHDFGKKQVKVTKPDGRDIFYRHPEVSAELARRILKRLKFDNYTLERTVRLVKCHGLKYDATQVDLRKALTRVGRDLFEDFIKVQIADIKGKKPDIVADKLKGMEAKCQVYAEVIAADQCFEIKGLAVKGGDLIHIGIPSGPLLGAILERLLDLVIEDQSLNTKAQLCALALQLKDDPKVYDKRPAFFK